MKRAFFVCVLNVERRRRRKLEVGWGPLWGRGKCDEKRETICVIVIIGVNIRAKMVPNL